MKNQTHTFLPFLYKLLIRSLSREHVRMRTLQKGIYMNVVCMIRELFCDFERHKFDALD